MDSLKNNWVISVCQQLEKFVLRKRHGIEIHYRVFEVLKESYSFLHRATLFRY